MEFWVKLILVGDTANQSARDNLYANCTHVSKNLWLFEGDEFSLDEGITFQVLDEVAIEGTGDLSQLELIEMVNENFTVEGVQIIA